MTNRPRVVIIGDGFGGLAAAKALRPAPVRLPWGLRDVPLRDTAGVEGGPALPARRVVERHA